MNSNRNLKTLQMQPAVIYRLKIKV